MAMILTYDRVEGYSRTVKGRVVATWDMPVHKPPIMPSSITELEKNKHWQRKSVGMGGPVMEIWRLIEAA